MPSKNFLPTTTEGYLMTELMDDYEIILGHRFSAFYKTTITGTAGTSVIGITSNSENRASLWASIETDKAGMYEMYEGAVISGGTVITSFNNDRESIEVADCSVVGDPSVATVGTFIGAHVIGSTTGGASKSGGSSNVNKYRMKLNTTYLFKFTADADNTRVTHGLYWRECHA